MDEAKPPGFADKDSWMRQSRRTWLSIVNQADPDRRIRRDPAYIFPRRVFLEPRNRAFDLKIQDESATAILDEESQAIKQD